ncbi:MULTISPECIES: hypothetical protein [unclassified Lacinutrix]
MDSPNLTVFNQIEKKETQLLFFNGIKQFTNQLNNETNFEVLIKSHLNERINENDSFSFMSGNQKSEMVNLGLDIIKNEFESRLINLEADQLRAVNQIKEDAFLNLFNENLFKFKEKVLQNQSDYESLLNINNNDSIDSLKEMSKIINNKYNPDLTTNVDEDINDFLNGGDLEF